MTRYFHQVLNNVRRVLLSDLLLATPIYASWAGIPEALGK